MLTDLSRKVHRERLPCRRTPADFLLPSFGDQTVKRLRKKCEHALISMDEPRFRGRPGPTWSARMPQPPQADERQHERYEPVAAAKPGPHRGVRERLREQPARRPGHDHAAQFDA